MRRTDLEAFHFTERSESVYGGSSTHPPGAWGCYSYASIYVSIYVSIYLSLYIYIYIYMLCTYINIGLVFMIATCAFYLLKCYISIFRVVADGLKPEVR